MFSMVSYGNLQLYLSFQFFSMLDFGHFNTFKYIVKWGTNSCNLCVTLKLKTVLKTVKYVYISFLQKCSPDMKNAVYVITSKLQKELKRGNP